MQRYHHHYPKNRRMTVFYPFKPAETNNVLFLMPEPVQVRLTWMTFGLRCRQCIPYAQHTYSIYECVSEKSMRPAEANMTGIKAAELFSSLSLSLFCSHCSLSLSLSLSLFFNLRECLCCLNSNGGDLEIGETFSHYSNKISFVLSLESCRERWN